VATGRSLVTVAVTDIVGSTQLASDIGDRAWRGLLQEHAKLCRDALRTHGGREVNFTGDGYVSTFSSSGDAVAFARELTAAVVALGFEIRVGIHAGEVEGKGRSVSGLTLNIAARVAAKAQPSEILVSGTVRDLLVGTPTEFAARGTHSLKGVGRRALFAVEAAKADAAAPLPAELSLLIVDDHPLWRQTLRTLIESAGVATVVFESGDGQSATEMYARHAPDVVLMDVDMPIMSGIEATSAITAVHPDARILVLSSLKEQAEVLAAVRAGATGYLIKTASAEEIVDAIARARRGELPFPPELSTMILAELRERSRDGDPPRAVGVAGLTERENSVLALMAAGHSNESIAKAIHVSTKTVESHVASIFTKLGLEAGADDNRRVKAVVTYLEASGAASQG
jgi:DNA-binding NarL/FixJ family response regulator/class 3 adenylate cyclase